MIRERLSLSLFFLQCLQGRQMNINDMYNKQNSYFKKLIAMGNSAAVRGAEL